jgi:hypothetical protein
MQWGGGGKSPRRIFIQFAVDASSQANQRRCLPMINSFMQIDVKGHGQLKKNITIDRKELGAKFQVLSQTS